MKVCDNCFKGAATTVTSATTRKDLCVPCFEAFRKNDWETLTARRFNTAVKTAR